MSFPRSSAFANSSWRFVRQPTDLKRRRCIPNTTPVHTQRFRFFGFSGFGFFGFSGFSKSVFSVLAVLAVFPVFSVFSVFRFRFFWFFRFFGFGFFGFFGFSVSVKSVFPVFSVFRFRLNRFFRFFGFGFFGYFGFFGFGFFGFLMTTPCIYIKYRGAFPYHAVADAGQMLSVFIQCRGLHGWVLAGAGKKDEVASSKQKSLFSREGEPVSPAKFVGGA